MNNIKSKKFAFTLAEVLITLAIIGVVAALTIPTLVQNYKKKEASTRLKKFYSMMQQVIKLSEIDNGSVEYWNKSSEVFNDDGKTDILANADLSEKFFTQYLAPYIKYNSIQKAKSAADFELAAYLADGTKLILHNGSCVDIYVDINGDKKPNSVGYDDFGFTLCISNDMAKGHCGEGKHFCALGTETYKTRETALKACKNSGYYCALLLFYDNFEFKDDYPYKL